MCVALGPVTETYNTAPDDVNEVGLFNRVEHRIYTGNVREEVDGNGSVVGNT
jgi:hypothetical protein